MSRKKDANKYWIYGEDAALAAQFTAYLATVLKNRRLTYIRHLKKIQKVECSYAGKIKAFRIGRSYRIPKVNVIRFLQKETPADCNTVNTSSALW